MKSSSDKVYFDEGNSDVVEIIGKGTCKILDVGCGAGSNAKILKSWGHIVDGVTISSEEGTLASKFLREVYIHDLEKGLPTEICESEYDFVLCSHVLEHITYPDQLLVDIRRVLKKRGYLLVALPNIMHYSSRFQLLRGNFDYDRAGIFDYTHTRWYTFETAKQLLIANNFEIVFAGVTGKIPAYSVLKYFVPDFLQRRIFSLLASVSKGFFGYQMIFKGENLK